MKKEEEISIDFIKKPIFPRMIQQAKRARKASSKNDYGKYEAACVYLTTIIIRNKKGEI